MYLITQKQQDNSTSVILGPMPWRISYFQDVITDELEINFKVPSSNPTGEAIIINDSVKIVPVKDFGPTREYNRKIECLQGPYYNFYEDRAEIYWIPIDKNIDIVKSELKQTVASNRYNDEIKGTTVNIQNEEIFVLTDRNERSIYLQAYQLGKDGVSWKFENKFLTLSNSDLGLIVNSIANHVQSVFDWEANKFNEINSALTLEQLDSISLTSENE